MRIHRKLWWQTAIATIAVATYFNGEATWCEPTSDPALPADTNRANTAVSPSDPRAIIIQMAPLVVISPKESNQCCFPADAEAHWADRVILTNGTRSLNPSTGKWDDGKHCEFAGIAKLPPPGTLSIPSSSYITACTKKKALYQKTFEQVPCWCEYYWEKPYLQAKYWMWWPFNDHPNDTNLNPFDHEGDWEHIELRAKLADDGTFRYHYYFDKHGTPELILPTSWESDTGGIKSHPKIWVAEGSHVPYESTGKKNVDIDTLPGLAALFDNVEDSNITWKTYDHLKFKSDDPTNPVWTYKGPWGSIDLTPSIPFFGRATDCPTGPADRKRYANSNGSETFP